MKVEDIKQRLHKYINEASSEQLGNLLSFVEEEEEVDYNVETKGAPWDDEEFVKEIDRRMEEIESGKVKGIPWEEVQKNVFGKYKK